MIRKINNPLNTIDFEPHSIHKETSEVVIRFSEGAIKFTGVLLIQVGYPNEEIYIHTDLFLTNDMSRNVIYEIQQSKWLKEIVEKNKVHPRHQDTMFDNYRHFALFFEDETFQCLAETISFEK